MKLYLKLIVLILLLGLAGPFFLKRPDGRPWMTANDLLPRSLFDLAALRARTENWWGRVMGNLESMGGEDPDPPSGKTKIYKWRAADGNWRFSDRAPPQGAEALWVDPNANVIQSAPPPAVPGSEKESQKEPEKEDAIPSGNGIPLPLSVSPAKVSSLMEDAKSVRQLVEQRNQKLEDAFNDARSSDD